eukprot:764184-Hanusia_phi.AAC.1
MTAPLCDPSSPSFLLPTYSSSTSAASLAFPFPPPPQTVLVYPRKKPLPSDSQPARSPLFHRLTADVLRALTHLSQAQAARHL